MDFSEIKQQAKDLVYKNKLYANTLIIVLSILLTLANMQIKNKDMYKYNGVREILAIVLLVFITSLIYRKVSFTEEVLMEKYIGAIFFRNIIGIFVVLGFIALIIPGIIIGCRLSFFLEIYLTEDVTAIQAIKKSLEITQGKVLEIFIFNLSFIGWLILDSLTFGIAGAFVKPYYYISYYLYYKKLSNEFIY